MKKLLIKIKILLLAFVVCFGAAFALLQVEKQQTHADASSSYISISTQNISFVEEDTDERWRITLNYKLQGLPTGIYQNSTKELRTDDTEVITLKQVSVSSDSRIRLTMNYDEYKKYNPTQIIFPVGLTFDFPTSYEGNYMGIELSEGMILTKTAEGWSVEPLEAVGGKNEYSVALDYETSALAWNEETHELVLSAQVPYSLSTAAEYENDAACIVEGVVYEETPVVRHRAESKYIEIVLPDADVIQNAQDIVSITYTVSNCENEASSVSVSFEGTLTYYKYIDGTWSHEKYLCISQDLNGAIMETKTTFSGEYALPEPDPIDGKFFLGWLANGELYKSGDSISLAEQTGAKLDITAVLISYELKEGASVRCDENMQNAGIRFAADVLKTDVERFGDYVCGFGVILMPTDLMGVREFTWDNYSGAGLAKNFFVEKEDLIFADDDYCTIYATIANLIATNYNRDFSARAYLLTATGEYLWEDVIEERTVYEVAVMALTAEDASEKLTAVQEQTLEHYINGVVDVYYYGESVGFRVYTKNSPIEIYSYSWTNEGLHLALKTELTGLTCLNYNNERITKRTEEVRDGYLHVTFEATK